MRAIAAGTRLLLKNFLFRTDFSEPSEFAVPFAVSLARKYQAKLYALHVLTPVLLACDSPESAEAAVAAVEEGAQVAIERLDSQLLGVTRETIQGRMFLS
jgi:nucleotide-binding universal stress UspA family protein